MQRRKPNKCRKKYTTRWRTHTHSRTMELYGVHGYTLTHKHTHTQSKRQRKNETQQRTNDGATTRNMTTTNGTTHSHKEDSTATEGKLIGGEWSEMWERESVTRFDIFELRWVELEQSDDRTTERSGRKTQNTHTPTPHACVFLTPFPFSLTKPFKHDINKIFK